MNTSLWSALLIGLGTGVVLFAAHYALDHCAPSFRRHPPRAYTVGVGILFGGYTAWGLLQNELATVAALFVLTGAAGLGTYLAYAWHGKQDRVRGARVARDLEGD